MRVDWSWDKATATGSQQNIHLANVGAGHDYIASSDSPGGNIEAVTAASEKGMQSKADEEGEGCGDEEVVEVDKEEGVGGQAEHTGGDDEGGQPEAAAKCGEPATQF